MNDKPKRRFFTRRRFLMAGGSVVAAGGFGVGGTWIYNRRQRFGRDATAVIPDHRVEVSSALPRMVIAKGPDPAINVRACVQRIGGMERLIDRSDVVLVKPNIGWRRPPEHAANTHPDVVAEVIRLCIEAGPKRVIVTDCPVRKSAPAFEWSGIGEAAAAAGAEVVIPEDSTYKAVLISRRIGVWDVLEPFVSATKIINVPVVKTHSEMSAIAGMKNWFGITTKARMVWHNDLDRSIVELAQLMRPTLTVADASRVMMRGGPAGGGIGAVKQVGAVAAAFDPVAIDAWAGSIFGFGPDELPPYIHLAEEAGLGKVDFRSLQPLEITGV
ncbi:MAG: DUF362 domain-containing protein [Thermoanaerobaculales bacterium]|jgi:uncharacterized protein (DUF362 family)|nr:DUF362 domain-containing protein [Thermoanaerobaculales bacterium]